jgi:hypothetical protein
MNRWPARKDYDSALNDPRSSFASPELKKSLIDKHGIVNIYSSGRFACVAKVTIEAQSWALRFFLTDQQAIEKRYEALQSRLKDLRPYFVDFTFNKEEVFIRSLSARFPVVKMEWVEGSTLGMFVTKACKEQDVKDIKWVRNELSFLRDHLRSHKATHGDLSAENVIVREVQGHRELVLVDYDGAWLREISTLVTSVGVGPLQHPRRPNPTGPHADVMAFEIFDVALGYLEKKPNAGNDSGLFDQRFLLSVDDLLNPETPLAKAVRQALPHEFERAASYARGEYSAVPNFTAPARHTRPGLFDDSPTETISQGGRPAARYGKTSWKLTCSQCGYVNRVLSPRATHLKSDFYVTCRCGHVFSIPEASPPPDVREGLRSFPSTPETSSRATVRDFARSLGRPRAAVLRLCQSTWPGSWTADTELGPEQTEALRQLLSGGSTTDEPASTTKQDDTGAFWRGDIQTLAMSFGVGTGQVRRVINQVKVGTAHESFSIPRSNSMQFTLTLDFFALIRQRITIERDARLSPPAPKPRRPSPRDQDSIQTTTNSETTWAHSIRSLAKMFGVTSVVIRGAIDMTSIPKPALNDMTMNLTARQLEEIEKALLFGGHEYTNGTEPIAPSEQAPSSDESYRSIPAPSIVGWFTLEDLAKRFGVNPTSVRNVIKQNLLLDSWKLPSHYDVAFVVDTNLLAQLDEALAATDPGPIQLVSEKVAAPLQNEAKSASREREKEPIKTLRSQSNPQAAVDPEVVRHQEDLESWQRRYGPREAERDRIAVQIREGEKSLRKAVVSARARQIAIGLILLPVLWWSFLFGPAGPFVVAGIALIWWAYIEYKADAMTTPIAEKDRELRVDLERVQAEVDLLRREKPNWPPPVIGDGHNKLDEPIEARKWSLVLIVIGIAVIARLMIG